jgi:hypothetical protein
MAIGFVKNRRSLFVDGKKKRGLSLGLAKKRQNVRKNNMRKPKIPREPYAIEPFDFERDGDAARCVPITNFVIPPWLALLTDDPDWQPEGGIG